MWKRSCLVREFVVITLIVADWNLLWSQIIARRHSQFSRPRLAVPSADETSLRLPQNTRPIQASCFCGHYTKKFGLISSRTPNEARAERVVALT